MDGSPKSFGHVGQTRPPIAMGHAQLGGPCSRNGPLRRSAHVHAREGPDLHARGGFFIFIFLKNIFYINIFSVSHFTVLYPYRPAGGGRDLHVNKYKLFLRGGPWWEPAAPLPGGRAASRPSTGRQGRQAPAGGLRAKKKYLFTCRSLPPPTGR